MDYLHGLNLSTRAWRVISIPMHSTFIPVLLFPVPNLSKFFRNFMKSHLGFIDSQHHRAYWISPKLSKFDDSLAAYTAIIFVLEMLSPFQKCHLFNWGLAVWSSASVKLHLDWVEQSECGWICFPHVAPPCARAKRDHWEKHSKKPDHTKRVVRLRSDQRNVHASTIFFCGC